MAEHARTDERIQTKIKNKGYTGYDDDEFEDGQAGMKKKVLAKYDEDINGPQETVRTNPHQKQAILLIVCRGSDLARPLCPPKHLVRSRRLYPRRSIRHYSQSTMLVSSLPCSFHLPAILTNCLL